MSSIVGSGRARCDGRGCPGAEVSGDRLWCCRGKGGVGGCPKAGDRMAARWAGDGRWKVPRDGTAGSEAGRALAGWRGGELARLVNG